MTVLSVFPANEEPGHSLFEGTHRHQYHRGSREDRLGRTRRMHLVGHRSIGSLRGKVKFR